MNIAIDASCLFINPYSGLSEVVHNLLRVFPKSDPLVNIKLFTNYFRRNSSNTISDYPNTEIITCRIPRRIIASLWNFGWPPFDYLYDEIDVYHSLHIQTPPVRRMKTVLTIHDCRKLGLPNLYATRAREEYRRVMQRPLERVDHVVTVSEFTKDELTTYFNYPREKVSVVYNGIDHKYLQKINTLFIHDSFPFTNRIDTPYMIYTGSLEPRKNLPRLINAYATFVARNKDAPSLAITGIALRKWKKSQIAALAQELCVADKILIMGELPKNELFMAIKSAEAICYPSLYEGFGLPPLEAMSLGVPVMAGNYAVANEILSNAALYVDPLSTDDIVAGMHRIIYDNELREALVVRGRKQVKRYSWERAVNSYLSVYRRAVRN